VVQFPTRPQKEALHENRSSMSGFLSTQSTSKSLIKIAGL